MSKQLIISSAIQKQVFDQIHADHQGIGNCREKARQSVQWPGLLTELEDVVSKCWSCCMNQAWKTEPSTIRFSRITVAKGRHGSI